MAVIKEPCEDCGSNDNLTTFDNGSQYCFTPDCSFNSRKKTDVVQDQPKELISGQYLSLQSRRISQRTCEVFGYQVGEYQGQKCHIANIYGDNKKLKAQQLRLPDKKFVMLGDTKDLGLVGKQLWGANGRHVVITEGYIDMLSVAESQDCRWPVVTVPNGAQSAAKAIKRDLAWLLGYENIILCFDNDDAGQKAIEDCVGLLPPGRVKIGKLSEKDANECLLKGKIKELTNLVFTAAEYRPDGIVAGSEIDIETLFQKDPLGLSLPYPILNETIRGAKEGRIITVYAGTGNGKTSFMKEVVYHFRIAHPNVKIGNIYLEEGMNTTVKSYIAMDNNIPTYKLDENPDILSKENKNNSLEKVIGRDKNDEHMFFYKHFGSLDSKRLFNMLEYLAVGKGVKVIVLDHISILVSGLESSGEGERRDIDKCMTQLRSFAERTGTILLVATQLKRTQGSYNNGADINEASARGSGSIEHLSDVIISINCDHENNPNQAQLKVIKNRITGQKCDVDLIYYNPETGRYLSDSALKQNSLLQGMKNKKDLNDLFTKVQNDKLDNMLGE
jgi:twinkle protein